MKLTIHRGAVEIGGSCVEIATDKTRIIIDAGLPLDDSRKNELPDVAGLFNPGSKVDAIFLSHSHPDHSGLLAHTSSDIPIYLTKGCSKMLMVSSLYAGQPQVPRERQRPMKAGRPVKVRDMTITPFDVDHSVFGSSALLVEADGKRVLYSGDLRLHGRKPGMARRLIRYVRTNPVDVLVMEGTHVGSKRPAGMTEAELENTLARLFERAASLVLGFFSPQNLDRLVSFYRATRRSKRTFVVDRYTAAVMYLLHTDVRIPTPSQEAGIRVYRNRVGRKVPKLDRKFADAAITYDEILGDPEKYVMVSRPSMIAEDFGSTVPVATLGVYSMWSGYLAKPEWVRVCDIIQRTPGDFVECHASGHISLSDIKKLVSELRPAMILPIHTAFPEEFRNLFKQTVSVTDGEVIAL
jgi:ribonuclease J